MGEKIGIQGDINNTECEFGITSITIELYQNIFSESNSKWPLLNQRRKIHFETYDEFPAYKEKSNIDFSFRLPLKLPFENFDGKAVNPLESKFAKQITPTVKCERKDVNLNFKIWYQFKVRVEHEKRWKVEDKNCYTEVNGKKSEKCQVGLLDVDLLPMKANRSNSSVATSAVDTVVGKSSLTSFNNEGVRKNGNTFFETKVENSKGNDSDRLLTGTGSNKEKNKNEKEQLIESDSTGHFEPEEKKSAKLPEKVSNSDENQLTIPIDDCHLVL